MDLHIPYVHCNDTFYLCDHEYEEFDETPLHPSPFTAEEEMKLMNLSNIINIIMLCIASVSLLANGIVLVIYYVMGRGARKIPNFMLFNQAVIDSLICIYAFLGTIPYLIPKMVEKLPHYATVVTVLGQYTVLLALGILVLTSGERFLALRRPFLHRRYVSKNKMIIAILLLYVVAFVPCIFYISFLNRHGEHDIRDFGMVYTSTRLAIVFFGIIFVLGVLYFTLRTVQLSIRHRTVRSPMAFGKVDGESKEKFVLSERKKERRMMSIFFTMAAVFTLSYLPMALINTIKLTTHRIKLFHMLLVEIFGFVLYIASAFVNPLLTLSLKDDYKRYLVMFLKKRKKEEIIDTKTELMSTSVM